MPTEGSEAKLGSGKLELERQFTPQPQESVSTKAGTYTAEKLGLDHHRSRHARQRRARLPSRWSCRPNWITTIWIAAGRRRGPDAEPVRAHVSAQRRDAEVKRARHDAGPAVSRPSSRPSGPSGTAFRPVLLGGAAPHLARHQAAARSDRRGPSVGLRPRARAARQARAGDLVTLVDERGPLATALADPASPIRARILDLDPEATCDGAWAFARAETAAAWRTRDPLLVGCTGRRLVHGEADGCPGLVIDQYADTAVIVFDGPAATTFWRARLDDVLAGLERGGAELAHAWLRGDRKLRARWRSGARRTRRPRS